MEEEEKKDNGKDKMYHDKKDCLLLHTGSSLLSLIYNNNP
jgi:hypothetical protein